MIIPGDVTAILQGDDDVGRTGNRLELFQQKYHFYYEEKSPIVICFITPRTIYFEGYLIFKFNKMKCKAPDSS